MASKYRRVARPRENLVKDEEEIRVTSAGSVSAYVSRAAKLFNEMDKQFIVITATGNALTKAVTAAEVIKRRFKGLHQLTTLGSEEIVDEYEPLEEGLDKVTDTRQLPSVNIKLSKEALDTTDKGYQEPIDESLVVEGEPDEVAAPRGRGKGKGKGRGKGKSKMSRGKSKGSDASSRSPSKGKGKGKSKTSKGKGKGKEDSKGKGKEDSKGKGKGSSKGKGKGKFFDDWPKGNGKSWNDGYKGKGKSKDKGKDSWGSKGGKSKGWGKDDWSFGGKGYGGGSSYGGGYDGGYSGSRYGGYSGGKSKGKSNWAW